MIRTMSVADAIEEYHLDSKLEQDVEDDEEVRVADAGETIEGPLDLDAGPLLALGDLIVNGNVLGREEGSYLVVLGSLRANAVLIGGPEVLVEGDLVATGAVMTDYNHGSLTVGGDLRARITLAEHVTTVRGTIAGLTVDFGGFRALTPGFVPTISRERATRAARDVFVPEVIDTQGYVSGRAMMTRLADGLAVLRVSS